MGRPRNYDRRSKRKMPEEAIDGIVHEIGRVVADPALRQDVVVRRALCVAAYEMSDYRNGMFNIIPFDIRFQIEIPVVSEDAIMQCLVGFGIPEQRARILSREPFVTGRESHRQFASCDEEKNPCCDTLPTVVSTAPLSEKTEQETLR